MSDLPPLSPSNILAGAYEPMSPDVRAAATAFCIKHDAADLLPALGLEAS